MSNDNTTPADGYYDEENVNSEEIDLSFLDEDQDKNEKEDKK